MPWRSRSELIFLRADIRHFSSKQNRTDIQTLKPKAYFDSYKHNSRTPSIAKTLALEDSYFGVLTPRNRKLTSEQNQSSIGKERGLL